MWLGGLWQIGVCVWGGGGGGIRDGKVERVVVGVCVGGGMGGGK